MNKRFFLSFILGLLAPALTWGQVLNPPNSLAITGGDTIVLVWKNGDPPVPNEMFFVVEIKKPNTMIYEILQYVARDVVTYTDRQFIPGHYCYRVKAINDAGDSDYTNEACIDFMPKIPGTTVLAVTNGGEKRTLTWTPIPGALSIKTYRRETKNGLWYFLSYAGNMPGLFDDEIATVGTVYCYRLKAYNWAGDGKYSNEVCDPN